MQQVAVSAKVEDGTGSLTPAAYWGTPAYTCTSGTHIVIEMDVQQGAVQTIHNGIAPFNAHGSRYATRDGEWYEAQEATIGDGTSPLATGIALHAVVGKFGQDGAPFLVGDAWEGAATADNLYLAVNDKKGQFHNNSGSFHYLVGETDGSSTHIQTLDPTLGWQNFGSYHQGAQLDIVADGIVVVGYGMLRDPDGKRLINYDYATQSWNRHAAQTLSGPSFFCSNLTQHALVGRIGRDGVPFLVGSQRNLNFIYEMAAEGDTSRPLFLAVNDSKSAFTNNSGSFQVVISAHRP